MEAGKKIVIRPSLSTLIQPLVAMSLFIALPLSLFLYFDRGGFEADLLIPFGLVLGAWLVILLANAPYQIIIEDQKISYYPYHFPFLFGREANIQSIRKVAFGKGLAPIFFDPTTISKIKMISERYPAVGLGIFDTSGQRLMGINTKPLSNTSLKRLLRSLREKNPNIEFDENCLRLLVDKK